MMNIIEANKIITDYESGLSCEDVCTIDFAHIVVRSASVTIEQMKKAFPPKFFELDFGNPMRGQGKRIGGMVTGGMFDLSLRGKKAYLDRAKQFGLIGDAAEEVNLFTSNEYIKYWKSRTAGFNHDQSATYAYDDS